MDALVLPGFGSDLLPFLSFALAKWVVLYIHVGHFLLETGSSNTKEVDIPPPLPPSHISPLPPLCPSLLARTVSYRHAGYFGNCYSYKSEWFGYLGKDERAKDRKRFVESLDPFSRTCEPAPALYTQLFINIPENIHPSMPVEPQY